MASLVDLPTVSDEDISVLKACATSPRAQEALSRLMSRQLSSIQEYHLLNIELFKAEAKSEFQGDQVREHMDDVWRRLSSEDVEVLHEEHDLLMGKYHEIFVASEVYRNEMEHRKSNEDARIETSEKK